METVIPATPLLPSSSPQTPDVTSQSDNSTNATSPQKSIVQKMKLRRSSNGSLSCPKSNKKLANKQALNNHLRIHVSPEEKEVATQALQKNKCYFCSKRFQTPSQLEAHAAHLLLHTRREKSYSCDKCSKEFRRACTLKSHQLTHPSRQCNLRKKLCAPKKTLDYQVVDGQIKKFQCEECHHQFGCKGTILEHINASSDPVSLSASQL